ncbi:MAG: hypothetical protein ABSG51_09055, partial [Terracidiphilus sp.]
MHFAESSTKHFSKLYAGLLAAAMWPLTGCVSGGVAVAILPNTASVQAGIGTQNFTATAANDPQNKGVTWSLSGTGCSGLTCGTLSNITAT